MLRYYLSDDASSVIVLYDDNEEPEVFNVSEFVEIFGEESLPDRDKPVVEAIVEPDHSRPGEKGAIIERYYQALSRLVDAFGEYCWAVKLEDNCSDGVFMAQKVAYDYFGNESASRLPMTVQERLQAAKSALKNFDRWSQNIGYKPMSPRDYRVLSRHLNDSDFRKKLRYRIKKYSKVQQAFSISELTREVLMARRRPRATEGE